MSSAGWNARIIGSEGMPHDSVEKAESEKLDNVLPATLALSPTDMIRGLLKQAVDNRNNENAWRMTMRQARTLITMGAQVAYARNDQTLIAEYNGLKKIADEVEAALLTNMLK